MTRLGDLRQRLAERAHEDGMETTAVRDEDLDALIEIAEREAAEHPSPCTVTGPAARMCALLAALGFE